MAIDDIIFEESDSIVLEITGVNSPINDVLFVPSGFVVEVTGTNGSVVDVLFDPSMTHEIPRILVTDFAFL